MVNHLSSLISILNTSVDSSAVFTDSMTLLRVDAKNAESFLSPVIAARFVMQYFPLESGDWVAVNDPRSGGVSPFGVNLVGRYKNLIWSVRMETSACWTEHEKWEQVGLRIPPLPIKIGGKINQQIPDTFLKLAQPFLDRLQGSITKFEKYLDWKSQDFKKDTLQTYLEKTEKALRRKLKDSPWLENQARARSATGENLCLKISFSENLVSADLSGSTAGQDFELNEKVTDSILIYGLNSALESLPLYNGQTEKYFQVTKPRQCWLNTPDPRFPARSSLLATPFLKSHMKQLLLKMKKPVTSWMCSRDGWTQFASDSGQLFICTDEIQKTWGAHHPLISVEVPCEQGLNLRFNHDGQFLKVESGRLLSGSFQKGQIWPFRICKTDHS